MPERCEVCGAPFGLADCSESVRAHCALRGLLTRVCREGFVPVRELWVPWVEQQGVDVFYRTVSTKGEAFVHVVRVAEMESIADDLEIDHDPKAEFMCMLTMQSHVASGEPWWAVAQRFLPVRSWAPVRWIPPDQYEVDEPDVATLPNPGAVPVGSIAKVGDRTYVAVSTSGYPAWTPFEPE